MNRMSGPRHARKVKDKPEQIEDGEFPSCFETFEQWRLWREAAQTTNLPACICDDCPSQFELEMDADGRCKRDEAVIRWAFRVKAPDTPSARKSAQAHVHQASMHAYSRQSVRWSEHSLRVMAELERQEQEA